MMCFSCYYRIQCPITMQICVNSVKTLHGIRRKTNIQVDSCHRDAALLISAKQEKPVFTSHFKEMGLFLFFHKNRLVKKHFSAGFSTL